MRFIRTQRIWRLCLVIGLFQIASSALARVEEIKREALPHDAMLADCIEKLHRLEPMLAQWTLKWTYAVPKKDVSKEVQNCINIIDGYLKKFSDNGELHLLKGLAAHFAYNLDLNFYDTIAVSEYKKAGEILSNDIRPEWFLAVHLAQYADFRGGIVRMQSIENSNQINLLPLSFWEDYLFCASLAKMPVHARRAYNIFMSKTQNFENRKRYWNITPEEQKQINWDQKPRWEEYWSSGGNISGKVTFINHLFGYSFTAPKEWGIQMTGLGNKTDGVVLTPPSKAGYHRKMRSKICIFAYVQEANETLDDCIRRNIKIPLTPIDNIEGNIDSCRILEGKTNREYTSEGGAHILIAAFEKNAPEYPGLIFEKPFSPEAKQNQKVSFYHFVPSFARVKGVIYYMLLLDSCESIFQNAKKEFEFVLNHMVAE